jgi:hypothetical protein
MTTLAAELLRMAEEDRCVRTELAAEGSLFGGYHPRMREVHDRHANRLAELLNEHGWPGEPLVGAEAAIAAWLVVQHAIARPGLQRRALLALTAAADRGEVPRWQPATLEDRIRAFEGRPQRYGTQLDWDAEGRLSPLPVEDPDRLDERRKAAGLPPLAEVLVERCRTALQEGERPPSNPAVFRADQDRWLREVGWRS